MIAIEAGWWLAEVGRQPWILVHYMKVAEAATSSDHVDLMLLIFCVVYLILGIGSVVVLRRMFKRNPIEKEIADRHAEKGGGIS
jgi:cytochrome d ubiquinol oxidase subunit I